LLGLLEEGAGTLGGGGGGEKGEEGKGDGGNGREEIRTYDIKKDKERENKRGREGERTSSRAHSSGFVLQRPKRARSWKIEGERKGWSRR